ncbi:PREDICTED: facilitated trehalose transporter Tret1-2 homolog [Nicrophorus vespilloides]|uniref:Facilitated trehalose transporter Tret1-2 homolog n=1 Tax=Nicrophorus vespilloides TaxID=110193 RepID=A0ABM1NDY8_NICVS|nr:PREDICTED: facilitated trehalose transporter Tret1-2 homolog [Nicrophorus vespilloides]
MKFTPFSNFFNQEWKQIFAILTAALVSLNTALLFAWPSPSIPILVSDEYPGNITMEQASYITVIPSISSSISSPIYPFLMDRLGRKMTLLSVAVPQLISWLLVAQTTNIYVIYVSRFLSGFSHSSVYATLPVYIGEVASPEVRGLWGNAMSCCAYLGLCLMNIIGAYFSIPTTAYIFATLPVLFFICFVFMPETPYYYIMRNELEKAKISLNKLRRNKNVEKEFLEIKEAVDRQVGESGSILDLFRVRSNLKGLLVAIAVRGAQQFAGISAFAVYAPYLFLEAGSKISANTSAIIFSSALTVCACSGSYFLDKLGRRWSMIISCAGCGLILISESFYFYFKDMLTEQGVSLPYFPIVGMLIYVPIYSLGLGIIPNLTLGELFSSNIKGKALCVLNICFAIYSSLSTKVFQLLYSNYGMHAPFLLFACCCLFSTIFAVFCMPETSGKTLEQIQQDLKGKPKETITRF